MNTKRNVYLDLKSIEEAKALLFEQFGHLSTDMEMVDVVHAKDRVLAEPVFASLSSPNYHAAAMDGIAVDASVTFGAHEESPVTLIPGKTAFWVNTGHLLPDQTNAVIMIEHLNQVSENQVLIESPAVPWQHVRKIGEDIVATELLFARGHRITSYCLGALLSGGIFRVQVYKQPRVLIIPTGNELVQWNQIQDGQLKPGLVIESNSTVLGGLCEDHGALFDRHETIEDDLEKIQNAVRNAVQKTEESPAPYDMVCICGGSSAGSKDFAKPVIESLGKVYVHGVTMMPGKPILMGDVSGKPVFGIPGYPVSAIVAFEQFVGPLLSSMQQYGVEPRSSATVVPARKMTSKLGQEEFIRVKIGSVNGKLIASQLPRGSGSITSITEADGIIRIPKHVEGLAEDETIDATLLRPRKAIENTVVIIGSHDNTLDLLSDQVRINFRNVFISSSHVGSMGGLMAIRKGMCHIAGSHLLDPEDGSYNVSYIQKYLPRTPVKLVRLAKRDQGLILPKGNPKKILSIQDLTREDVNFINRQAGSGTRVLFDYQLSELNISTDTINGYQNDEYTHMSVAAAVLSGRADTGLGILAAAKALDLDFIPVVTENYDLIIPEEFYDLDTVQKVLASIRSESFIRRISELGGYHTERTGQIVFES